MPAVNAEAKVREFVKQNKIHRITMESSPVLHNYQHLNALFQAHYTSKYAITTHLRSFIKDVSNDKLVFCNDAISKKGMRVSKIIRAALVTIKTLAENHLGSIREGSEHEGVLKSILTAYEMTKVKNPKTKQTFLDNFLANNLVTDHSIDIKIHISNKWPRFRGMFGDPDSCFYPEHDYGWCWEAVENCGYVVRAYEADVPDKKILACPDNPLGVQHPKDTDENTFFGYGGAYEGKTTGCVGRAILLPVEYITESGLSYPSMGVVNAYFNQPYHGFTRDLISKWLADQLGLNSYLALQEDDYDQWYINGGKAWVLSSHKTKPAGFLLPEEIAYPQDSFSGEHFPEEINKEIPF